MPIGTMIVVAIVLIVVAVAAAVLSHFLTVSNLKNNAESHIGKQMHCPQLRPLDNDQTEAVIDVIFDHRFFRYMITGQFALIESKGKLSV